MIIGRSRSLFAAAVAAAALFFGALRPASAQIYVSDVGSNTIKQYDQATGQFVKVFAQGGGLSVPFGLAWGPDRNLYVSSLATHEILRCNGTTGEFIDKFLTKGGAGELFYPNQIAFGPDDNLYVASYSSGGRGAILQYQGPSSGTPGAFIKTFASTPGMEGPTGFAFNNDDGNLYVSSSKNNAIFRFDGLTGGLIGGGPLVPGSTSGLNGPAGLGFGPNNGKLYVTNFFPTTPGAATGVMEYDIANPGARSSFTGSLDLNGPASLVFGNDLKMYVTSYRNNTIYRFNGLTGAFDNTWSLSGGNLINPTYMILGLPPGGGGAAVAVPEPASVALLGLGASGLAAWSLRRNRKS